MSPPDEASAERRPESVSPALAVLAAALPIALAIVCDPEARAFDGDGRSAVLGLTLGGDRSLAAPIGQLLGPLARLLPVGSLEHRTAIALALPASLATFVVARRITERPWAASRAAAAAIVLAFSSIAGVLLGSAPPEASIALLAIELAAGGHALAWAALPIALWAAPRLAPAVIAAAWLGKRPALGLHAIAPLVPAIALLAVRDTTAWLTVGRALRAPPFFASTVAYDGAALRAIVVTVTLAWAASAIAARSNDRADRRRRDRAELVAGSIAGACALLASAPGGGAVAASALAPIAAGGAGALAIAATRAIAQSRAHAARFVVAALVPALALGLAARAFETQVSARRLSLAAAAAHDASSLFTLGLAPPRSVLLVEEEAALLSFARERALHALRPDLRVLPTQGLLATGAARMATCTLAALPAATEPLRALLARGALDPSALAPLAQQAGVVAELPAARLRPLARHAAPTAAALVLSLERVDPSERRARRPLIDRRATSLALALDSRPRDDRLRRALRIDATREARVLSIAGDRDGAIAAVLRARAFGAPDDRAARWVARLQARQPLDAEPLTDDD